MEAGGSERRVYPVMAGEYKLLEEIGQGVSATVYRAICLPFREVVAIKALDLEKCNSNLDDIRREAVTMSLIDHPNVVKAFCSFVVEQSLWVVMPFMAGGSCLHIMKAAFQDGFEEPVIATFLKETLKALEYLHRHGHIHRDVKAGNILVDGNGAVKLGDFGVSACMFDTGDRQRSRKTFVGTPCWMAPEVMEQLNGYDFKIFHNARYIALKAEYSSLFCFPVIEGGEVELCKQHLRRIRFQLMRKSKVKADIWSFGITALELAHGHAPFSKYPPMKVLLMTLQNAPPGLDYDSDKRFSKSFKEMIAMCLVKEPAKRPSAEKLLRHSFFKHARTPDYICRHVLEGLPSLGDRVKNLKKADIARLEQQKVPQVEQEERSQSEYKRGVSSWNFNVEDLKAQSALMPDDDSAPPRMSKVDDVPVPRVGDEAAGTSRLQTPSQPGHSDYRGSNGIAQLPVTIHSLRAEIASDAEDRVTRVRSGPLPSPVLPAKLTNSQKPAGVSARKEPKHIGRFDVFEDDTDLESPGWHKEREEKDYRNHDHRERREDQREKAIEDREREETRRCGSGPLVPERVLSSSGRGREEDRDREKEYRQGGRAGERGSFSGPLLPTGDRTVLDHRPANGVQGISKPSTGTKEASEEKSKGPAQKVPVVQKGRFSVTSDDRDVEDPPHVSSRRNTSSQGSQQQQQSNPALSSSSNLNGAVVPVAAVMPHIQTLLQLNTMSQESLLNIYSCINHNPSEIANSLRTANALKTSRNSSVNAGSENSMVELSSERERELLQQLSELQSKYALVLEENQAYKLKNVSLERQLNAIFNKEEEERIRKEEAAKEDG